MWKHCNFPGKISTRAKYFYLGTTGLVLISHGVFNYLRRRRIEERRPGRLIVISGCDTDLGLAMAKWAADLGYQVLAGCLDVSGEGAELLKAYSAQGRVEEEDFTRRSRGNIFVEELDVTNTKSVGQFHLKCLDILRDDRLEFYALILNAGISIVGEYFWITEEQKRRVFEVNFWGAVNLASAFQRQILEQHSRIIVIGNETPNYSFPSTSLYGASKGALEGWAKTIRMELAKYGITVVVFQPGTFPNQFKKSDQAQAFAVMRQKLEEQSELKDVYIPDLDIMAGSYGRFFGHPAPPLNNNVVLSLNNWWMRRAFRKVLEDSMKYAVVYKCENTFQIVLRWVHRFPRPISDRAISALIQFPNEGPRRLRALEFHQQ